MRTNLFMIFAVTALLVTGCAAPKIRLFPDATIPLQEFTLHGTEKGKVLVIPIRGVISDAPQKGFPCDKPSMVQEIVSQLRLAEKDEEVRAVLLKIDSPGGPTTASDVLYHEIMAFKKRTGAKVIVAMMDVAASGGYYVSLPADFILAHPTTVTGSIGAIFIRPKVTGVMEKIGLDIKVNKSGRNKDMGSPFRQTTEEEQKILQGLIDEQGGRFVKLVAKHRKLDQKALADIFTARVYLAEEALQLGLVDKIGYLSDAVLQAKKLAGLPEDTKVVVYRRTEYPDDNIYNTFTTQYGSNGLSLIDLGLPDSMTSLRTGFYYLWLPAAGRD
ncbi:MAG: signal peptide peptidase SppA [Desulfobacterales bacterium]|nr:signal peptide peptidase SppA [Desulfobacterales bacterium]